MCEDGQAKACARLYAMALLVITAVLAVAMLGTPVLIKLADRILGTSMFDTGQWIDCCESVGLALFAVLYAPLISVMAVYWIRSRTKNRKDNC